MLDQRPQECKDVIASIEASPIRTITNGSDRHKASILYREVKRLEAALARCDERDRQALDEAEELLRRLRENHLEHLANQEGQSLLRMDMHDLDDFLAERSRTARIKETP